MSAGRCSRCGVEHEELEPAFRLPDAVFAVPEEERPARVRESEDFVVVDDRAYFIRCVAPVPVEGREHPYCWGLWVRVAQRDYEEHERYFEVDPPLDHPGFQGTIANQTLSFPPTLGLPVHVHLGRGNQRPRLMLLDAAHPLTAAQERGVDEAQVHDWWESLPEVATGRPRREPPAPWFRATLEDEGWEVATPEESGPMALPRTPRPGDEVKAAFRFLAAGADGAVASRIELMWVLIDQAGDDGRWSGVLDNHPFRPATLDAGTRVWLTAADAIDFRPSTAPEPSPPPAPPGLLDRLRSWWRGRAGSP